MHGNSLSKHLKGTSCNYTRFMCRAVLKKTNQVQGGIEGVLVFAGHHPDYNGLKKGGREQPLYLKAIHDELVPLDCIHDHLTASTACLQIKVIL
jgi:hypothetical protein